MNNIDRGPFFSLFFSLWQSKLGDQSNGVSLQKGKKKKYFFLNFHFRTQIVKRKQIFFLNQQTFPTKNELVVSSFGRQGRCRRLTEFLPSFFLPSFPVFFLFYWVFTFFFTRSSGFIGSYLDFFFRFNLFVT